HLSSQSGLLPPLCRSRQLLIFLRYPRLPSSTLLPYTTLFRSMLSLTVNGRLSTSSETHDVVATIDVNGLAGDGGARVGKQERSRIADFAWIHIAFQRGAFGLHFKHFTEIRDTAGG